MGAVRNLHIIKLTNKTNNEKQKHVQMDKFVSLMRNLGIKRVYTFIVASVLLIHGVFKTSSAVRFCFILFQVPFNNGISRNEALVKVQYIIWHDFHEKNIYI